MLTIYRILHILISLRQIPKFLEKMCFPKIILYSISIKKDDRRWFDAASRLRRTGRLPNW